MAHCLEIEGDSDFGEVIANDFLRINDKVSKIGYADGIADGRESAFQISFDKGYADGLKAGFKLAEERASNTDQKQVFGQEKLSRQGPTDINAEN